MSLKRFDAPTSLLPFEEVSQGPSDARRVFTVRSDVVRSQAKQREMTVDRLVTTDWVNVVALDAQRRSVMIRQYRFGVGYTTLETPGGMVDPGEDSKAAAARELCSSGKRA